MLLEKAWAKIMGSYCLMDMGTSQEVFMAIEGAPSHVWNHEEVENS